MITSYSGAARLRLAGERVVGYAERAVANRYVAYTAIAALQLRVIWDIWRYADLTNGDTSFYFRDAASWAHGLHEDVVYYPLYDAFWGTILAVVHDVYAATIAHRVVIIFAVTLLVLALMRSLLGPALGLLIAAWWAIVPANYHVLYEVHLFGVLPILIVVLVVARAPRREGLGIALAILLASAVLVRNELIAVAAILAVAVVVYEVHELRTGHRARGSSYLRAYVVPLAIASLLIGGAYARSYIQGDAAWRLLQAKEEDNFCATYAASYQQRHPTRFTGNPFTQCSPLMQHEFGRPMPTLLQAIAANPRAVAGFSAWDAQLLPGGLQVGLLGATAFDNNPGFRRVPENSTYALVLSVVLLIAVIAGLGVAAGEGKLSLRRAPPRTLWVVITLASIALGSLFVALTTRPWPEWIYGLPICALVLIGVSVSALLRRVGGTRIIAPVALATVLVLIAALPSFYSPASRPIYEAVQHLQVVKRQLQRTFTLKLGRYVPFIASASVLVAGENYNELCNYLAYSYKRGCIPKYWPELRAQVAAGTSAGQVLDRVHATVIYADAGLLADPIIARLVAAPRAQGWQQVSQGAGPDGPWRVLARVGHPV